MISKLNAHVLGTVAAFAFGLVFSTSILAKEYAITVDKVIIDTGEFVIIITDGKIC